MEQPPKYTDEDLRREAEAIKASMQDARHFKVLYDRYYTPVFRFIWSRVSDRELTADLVSEVFYKALLNLHRYQPRGVPFSAWLFRVAINEIAMYYRKSKKERVVSLDKTSLAGLLKELHQDEKKEELELLFKVLEELTEEEMNLVELRIFEERPFKEVAEITGITENNAKVRYYRIVDKMTRIYREKENL